MQIPSSRRAKGHVVRDDEFPGFDLRAYRLDLERVRAIDEWLAPYRTKWTRSLDALELVAGAEREPLLAAVANPILRSALPALAANAELFGSVCSGGFLLAALGLLISAEN